VITFVLLTLIVAVGIVIRLHLLGRKSLWLDEAASVTFARLPWMKFWRVLWEYEGNMAFYYVLLRGWVHFGDSEMAVRSLSVVFGVAAIPAAYALGKRLFSTKAGLISAALLAVHSFHIRCSQEARSYSLLVLLLVLSTYFFVRLVESPRQHRYWAAYILIGALAVYSHVFALLVLIPQWLSLGRARLRQIGLVRILWTTVGLTLLVMPMAVFVLLKSSGQIAWISRPTIYSFFDFARLLTGDGGNALLVAYAVFCLVAVLWLPRSEESKSPNVNERWPVRLVALWLVFPIASTLCVSFVKPLFYERFMVMCVPAVVLLAGQGITAMNRVSPRVRWVLPIALCLMVSLSVWGVGRYFRSFASTEEDWRSAVRYIFARQQLGDVIFFAAAGRGPFNYYIQRETVEHANASSCIEMFPSPGDPSAGVSSGLGPDRNLSPKEKVGLAAKGHNRVWLVLYHERSPKHNAEVAAMQAALQENFRLIERHIFRGMGQDITVALYLRAR